MAERSAGALHWLVLVLALWVLTRLMPATGARRKASTAMRRPANKAEMRDRGRLVVCRPTQRRSPYSMDRGVLDGSESRLSRPYLSALDDRAPVVGTRSAHFRLDLDSRGIQASVPAGGGVR